MTKDSQLVTEEAPIPKLSVFDNEVDDTGKNCGCCVRSELGAGLLFLAQYEA